MAGRIWIHGKITVFEQISTTVTLRIQFNNSFEQILANFTLQIQFNSWLVCYESDYTRVDCCVEFCRRGGDPSLVSCVGVDPLEDGLAPAEMMFLNQAPWKVGLPLFWLLPGDSEA